MTSTGFPGRLVVVVLVVALTTSTLSAAVGADTARTTPEFAASAVMEERGDVATIVVRMEDGGTAEVDILGKGDSEYEAHLTLRDRNSDGRVTLEFNTYLSGRSAAFSTAADRDEVVVHGQAGGSGVLPVGSYRMLTDGGNDLSDLEIEQGEVRSVIPMVAPAAASDRLETGDDVVRFRRAGNLTTRPANDTVPVAERDTLVLRLRASGIGGALAAQDGDDATERFRSLVASDLLSLDVDWTNTGTEEPDVPLLLNRSGVSVVTRPDDDDYFVVIDTAAVQYRRGGIESGLPAGAELAVNATVPASSELAAGSRETSTASFRMVERSASLRTHREGDGFYLLPERGQTLQGRTTLAPGSTVDLRVSGPDGLQRTRTVRVGRSEGLGTFETTLDLRSVGEGTTLSVTAAESGTTLTDAPIEPTVRSPGATLGSPELKTEGTTLLVALEANLTRGGLVTVRAYNRSGRLVGTTAVESSATTVEIPIDDLPPEDAPLVVTAIRDLDADGEFTQGVDAAYQQSNAKRPVTQTVTLYTLPPSPTPTGTTPTASTPTAATTSPATGNDTPTSGGATATEETASPAGGTASPTGDGPIPTEVPGFGPAVAAVALALVALRRMW